MVTAQPRRRRSRIKAGGQFKTPAKYSKPLHLKKVEDEQSAGFEETHSLLVASLRYWEVERDLIEERLAAVSASAVF